MSDPRGICPTGWHIPTHTEWINLVNYQIQGWFLIWTTCNSCITTDQLDFDPLAKILASATGWNPSDLIGAPGNPDYPEYADGFGFSALPGGQRLWNISDFEKKGEWATFWYGDHGHLEIYNYGGPLLGYSFERHTDLYYITPQQANSVRCKKD